MEGTRFSLLRFRPFGNQQSELCEEYNRSYGQELSLMQWHGIPEAASVYAGLHRKLDSPIYLSNP